MKKPPSQYKRILCIRVDRIGDMFITTPAFKALRRNCPDARIDVVASVVNAGVLKDNADVDNVYSFNKKSPFAWLRLLSRLLLNRYDLVLAFNGASTSTALLAKLLFHHETYAVSRKNNKFFYTEVFDEPRNIHHVERQLAFLRHLGFSAADVDMCFNISPEVMSKIAARHPRKPDLPRIGIFIGNIKKIRTRWPVEKFAELTDRLLEKRVELYIVAGSDDIPLLDAFKGRTDERLLYYIGDGSFEESAAFFKTCDLFVTSSSGPMHIAAAVDVPCVSIVFPEGAVGWSPLGERHSIVVSTEYSDVRDITVDSVLSATLKALSERTGTL